MLITCWQVFTENSTEKNLQINMLQELKMDSDAVPIKMYKDTE